MGSTDIAFQMRDMCSSAYAGERWLNCRPAGL